MARARNIKPGFFRNAELVELPFEARLLFIGLWTIADREGRLEDRPKQIKMEVFPADNVDCNQLIDSLELAGMIERYTVEGGAYIQIISFTKHQNPHKDEKTSEIPNKHGCLTDSRKSKHGASTMQEPCNIDVTSEPILLNPESLSLDSLNPETSSTSKDLPPPPALPEKKATRLPKDWQLPNTWGQWALLDNQNLTADDIRRMAEMFKDHWLANASRATGKKDDWYATWRNWVRKSHPNKAGVPRSPATSYHEKLTDTAEQIFGKRHGTGNTVIDITPKQATGSDPENIPAVYAGLRA